MGRALSAHGTNVVLTDGPPPYQFPGVPRVGSCSGPRPVLLATVLGLLIPLGAVAALLPGGGPRRTDCFALLDVEGPPPPGAPRKVSCVDGDPHCDADGMCDGTCQFTVRVCVNDEGVAAASRRRRSAASRWARGSCRSRRRSSARLAVRPPRSPSRCVDRCCASVRDGWRSG